MDYFETQWCDGFFIKLLERKSNIKIIPFVTEGSKTDGLTLRNNHRKIGIRDVKLLEHHLTPQEIYTKIRNHNILFCRELNLFTM